MEYAGKRAGQDRHDVAGQPPARAVDRRRWNGSTDRRLERQRAGERLQPALGWQVERDTVGAVVRDPNAVASDVDVGRAVEHLAIADGSSRRVIRRRAAAVQLQTDVCRPHADGIRCTGHEREIETLSAIYRPR